MEDIGDEITLQDWKEACMKAQRQTINRNLKLIQYKFVDMCILQAKRIISLNWKNVDAPRIGRWIEEMASNMTLEKITYIIRWKQHVFDDIWRPFRRDMMLMSVTCFSRRRL